MFLFKRNNGYYYFYYQNPLTNKRTAITTKSKTIKDAKKFISDFLKGDKETIKQVTYFEALESEVMRYVVSNLSKTTCLMYVNAFKQVKRILGNKPISLYTALDIERYKTERIKTIEKTTCNIELRVIKAVFNLAIKWGWLKDNPFNGVNLFTIADKIPMAFNADEVNRILSVIDKPVIMNIVKFTLNTGCRINEVLNVQLKDINLIDRVISISNKETFKTKTRRNREIPVNDTLFDLLNGLINKSNVIEITSPETYLFNRNGFRYNKDFISKSFKKYLRIAGLPEKFHFHCLRHTVITNLIRAGANIRYVQQIAGHSNLETTERYTHLTTNDLRQAINLLK